jgi:hypothetical protein
MIIHHAARPERLPSRQRGLPDGGVGRVSKRSGQRQLFFLPSAVVKLGFSRPERLALLAEARGSVAAARHPFWARLAVRTFGLGGAGFFSRRFDAVRLADFDAVARLVEQRLEDCGAHAAQPMAGHLVGRLEGLFERQDRERLAAVMDGHQLPRSSMHGDLHFFNFVRAGDGFRVIDWEHFDAGGSFVFDYLNFFIAVDRLNLQRPWTQALAALGPDHPAVRRAAALTGVPARTLLLYFLVLKIDIGLARRGGPDAVPETDRRSCLALLRQMLVGAGAVVWSQGQAASWWTVLAWF